MILHFVFISSILSVVLFSFFFTSTLPVYNEPEERTVLINSSKILSSPVGFRDRMKILIAYTLMLYQLQIAELVIRQQWQQVWDRYWFEDTIRRAVETSRPCCRTRIKQNNELLLLLDQPTPEQRKWTDIKQKSTPSNAIHVQTRSSCSCESQYEVRDLGDGHYPRYLTASNCKPKTCQNKFRPCKLLHYMVHVLRLRDVEVPSKWFTDDDGIPETPLPEFLRRKWQMKPISVPVACVPA